MADPMFSAVDTPVDLVRELGFCLGLQDEANRNYSWVDEWDCESDPLRLRTAVTTLRTAVTEFNQVKHVPVSPGHESITSEYSSMMSVSEGSGSPRLQGEESDNMDDVFVAVTFDDVMTADESNDVDLDLIRYMTSKNNVDQESDGVVDVEGVTDIQQLLSTTTNNEHGENIDGRASSFASTTGKHGKLTWLSISETGMDVQDGCSTSSDNTMTEYNGSRVTRSTSNKMNGSPIVKLVPVTVTQSDVGRPTTQNAKSMAKRNSGKSKYNLKNVSGPTDVDGGEDHNNKNAIQARINREKKKLYMKNLETDVSKLTKENEELKNSTMVLAEEKLSLEEEVAYLKNVIANQSSLSNLLKNIDGMPGVNLTTSFRSDRKRSVDIDHDYQRPFKRARDVASGGVCLHVDKDNVSLEFCSKCARMAQGGARSGDS